MSVSSVNSSTLSSISSDTAGYSVQFIYAMMQMELAQTNKDKALEKIEGIRESQAKSAEITEAITKLRNCKNALSDDDDYLKIGNVTVLDSSKTTSELQELLEAASKTTTTQEDASYRQQYLEACIVCLDYGIEYSYVNVDSDDIDLMIASLEAAQEELSSDIQTEMVFIEDYMGQYNSYTQGASSAIADANETLALVARGG